MSQVRFLATLSGKQTDRHAVADDGVGVRDDGLSSAAAAAAAAADGWTDKNPVSHRHAFLPGRRVLRHC
jgi:hypothetical protein